MADAGIRRGARPRRGRTSRAPLRCGTIWPRWTGGTGLSPAGSGTSPPVTRLSPQQCRCAPGVSMTAHGVSIPASPQMTAHRRRPSSLCCCPRSAASHGGHPGRDRRQRRTVRHPADRAALARRAAAGDRRGNHHCHGRIPTPAWSLKPPSTRPTARIRTGLYKPRPARATPFCVVADSDGRRADGSVLRA